MNEQLKSVLMLPLSKRFIVAILATTIIIANRKFNLGLSNEDAAGVAGVAAAIILGLSIEQSAGALAKKEERKP
jgi:hypothetical protein